MSDKLSKRQEIILFSTKVSKKYQMGNFLDKRKAEELIKKYHNK